MKNIFSILGFFLHTFIFSQEIKYGVKGGLNISNLNNADNIFFGKSKSKIGFNIGGFAEYSINEKWALQPEFVISTQGAKFENSGSEFINGIIETYSVKKNVNLTYLTIPLMVKYKLTDKFGAEFGPQVGIALSFVEKIDAHYNGKIISTEINAFEDRTIVFNGNSYPIKANGNRFNLGLNFGLSYDLPNNIFIQARYNFDLTNIARYPKELENLEKIALQDDYLIFVIDQTEAKNSVFQFSIGYKF